MRRIYMQLIHLNDEGYKSLFLFSSLIFVLNIIIIHYHILCSIHLAERFYATYRHPILGGLLAKQVIQMSIIDMFHCINKQYVTIILSQFLNLIQLSFSVIQFTIECIRVSHCRSLPSCYL